MSLVHRAFSKNVAPGFEPGVAQTTCSGETCRVVNPIRKQASIAGACQSFCLLLKAASWPLKAAFVFLLMAHSSKPIASFPDMPSKSIHLRYLNKSSIFEFYKGDDVMTQGPHISLMLAVNNTPAAVEWYQRALGATLLWSLGSVAGLEIAGAPFFLGEPANNGWESPEKLGITSARVEVFCDDPDSLIARAVEAGAIGTPAEVRDYQAPWGTHRQGGFTDPFGHIWFVGDRSPLNKFP
jgi:uncharacterized glyoxalase superfamily protein PhnB